MKVSDHLKNATSTLFSIEILPPLKGRSIQSIYNAIDPLLEFKPAFIDVTYHREEFVYKKLPNGGLEKKSVKKRPGTVGICAAIMNKYKIDAVPHIICGGFTKEETEDALIDLSFLGIDNVLVLRGDSIKSEGAFKPEEGGNAYASDLLQQVVAMNKGQFLEEELQDVEPTSFCIGVAGYPEKHFESPNMKNDLRYLKMKVDLGAEYIVTQMFFDNKKFFDFVQNCRDIGINVPIIPGLKVLTSKKQLNLLPSTFKIDMPDDLAEAAEKARDNEQVKEIGIEWCVNQCKELLKQNIPCLHFYTMGTSEVCRRVASQVF
jgi:methylenetetrahydrofolate reductase (NADPH)